MLWSDDACQFVHSISKALIGLALLDFVYCFFQQGSTQALGRVIGRMLQAHPHNASKFTTV